MATIPYENEYGLWVSLDEYNRTKRALWLARAERAKVLEIIWGTRFWNVVLRGKSDADKKFERWFYCKWGKWQKIERKCRAYADKFREVE